MIARVSGTAEGETPSAGGYGIEVAFVIADVGDCPQVSIIGVPTGSDPAAHDRTTIVAAKVVGQYFRDRVPVTGGEMRLGTVRNTWLAAFSSRGACGCSSSKRASAASRSASSKSSQRLIRSPSNAKMAILPPFGVEALL